MKAKYIIFICIVLLIASCSTVRKVQVIQDALTKKDTSALQIIAEKTKVDSGLIVKNIIDHIAAAKLNFNTLNARVKVDYENVSNADSYIANISIQKGESIYITIRGAMGVIGLKALVTKDSVVLVYPLKKKQEKRPLLYLQELLKIPVDYTAIEDLIIGNPIYMDKATIVSYKTNNNKLQVGLLGKVFKNLISLNDDNTKVLHLKLDDIDINQHRTCDITYFNHTPALQNQFPLNRDIAISAQSRLEIHMEVKEFSFNDPLKYTFAIPKPGKRR